MADQLYLKYLSNLDLQNMTEDQLVELLIEPITGFDATWDINADFLIEKDFTWDVGEEDVWYWYRIEGKAVTPDVAGIGIEPADERAETSAIIQGETVTNKFKLLTVIAAKSVSDLCTKMKQNQLFPPIQTEILSIKKYSRPVLKSSYKQFEHTGHGLTQAPIDNSYNILTLVDFSQVPECMEFSMGETVAYGGGFAYVTESLHEVTGSGGVEIGGSGETNGFVIGPAQGAVMDGGIVISGSAAVDKHFAEGGGGVVLGGSSWFGG
jgi:hypothetical protein